MSLHGKSILAGTIAAGSSNHFFAISPLSGKPLEPAFHTATREQIDEALQAAEKAFPIYSRFSAEKRAAFLEKIAEEIISLGEVLLQRAHEETGLPLDRLTGERGRTAGQLRLFAEVIREGSWLDARIDTALPERQPLPRPDLRRMLIPLGPVAVFGASNFPLAFSVAGGDTASALAAGCPVIVKGHPAHPGTSELVASAVAKAAQATGMPNGVFSLIQGNVPETGIALVHHHFTKAVGFTGSHHAGRALFDAANNRPDPIPVFAEMSSLNPVVLLSTALSNRGPQIAEGLKTSITMGVGQFCTKPGLVFAVESAALDTFRETLKKAISSAPAATMLHKGICDSYHAGLEILKATPNVKLLAASEASVSREHTQATAAVFETDAYTFLTQAELHEELFGPQTLLVVAKNENELFDICRALNGQLTATIHADPADMDNWACLLSILQQKAGRVLVNGFPTGVEVSPTMQHGGPYPATTDTRFTSVGSASIQRWVRPICFQNFPESALPEELQNANPRNVMRLVNNQLTRDRIA